MGTKPMKMLISYQKILKFVLFLIWNFIAIAFYETSIHKLNPTSSRFVFNLEISRIGNNNSIAKPLDAVYTRLYGTKIGYAVPSDIYFHWNATYRLMPTFERNMISDHIEHIFNCDFENVITEFLTSRFWFNFYYQQLATTPYINCLKNMNLEKCYEHLESHCPKKMGEQVIKQQQCHIEIEKAFKNEKTKNPAFKKYSSCINQLRTSLNKCIPILKKTCLSKQVRVIKTVRLQIKTIENLLEKYSNLRIIHLMRDPRGTVLSRMKCAMWCSSGIVNYKRAIKLLNKPNKTNVEKNNNNPAELSKQDKNTEKPKKAEALNSFDFKIEAKIYCTIALQEHQKIKEITRKYPGLAYEVVYEGMLDNFKTKTEMVYTFINESIPNDVVQWMEKKFDSIPSSLRIARKWQSQLPKQIIIDIEKICSSFFNEINYNWP